MNFNISENQSLIAGMVRDFCEKNIRPHVMEWDEAQECPRDIFSRLGENGLMGILIPEKYNGAGLGYEEYITALIELSKTDGSLGLSVAAHNSLCCNHILKFGNEEQKQKWLPKLATAEWLGAWALTEPNTGSDALNMQTTAYKEGGHWILNGTKNFITQGKSSDVAVVIARTGEKGDSRGATAFVVEKDTDGFYAGRKENKLGMRASETTELIFDNCKVPEENILGEFRDGFIQALKILDGGRVSIAALSCGIAEGAYEHALAYSKERQQFGKPISENQGISFKLADMATETEAAKLLTFQAGTLIDQGHKTPKESSMAKYYASEVAVSVANDAVQIYGGYGFTKDYPVEKYYRDAKLCTIGEGTSEIQKLVIGREILK